MQAALDALKNLIPVGCVLLGDPNYYSRFGFKSDSRLVLLGCTTRIFGGQFHFTNKFPVGIVTTMGVQCNRLTSCSASLNWTAASLQSVACCSGIAVAR